MKFLLLACFCSLLILTFISCNTTTSRLGDSGIPNLSRYNSLRLTVSSKATAKNTDHEKQLLESLVAARLGATELFERIIVSSRLPDQEAPLELRITIMDMRDVGQKQRELWGGLAGPGSVAIEVEAIELPSEKHLGMLMTEASSPGVVRGEGTTIDSIDRAVDEIVSFVNRGKLHDQ